MGQVFSCEFCKIFKSTSFFRTPPVAASVQLYRTWITQKHSHRCLLLVSKYLLCGTVSFQGNHFKLSIRLALFEKAIFLKSYLTDFSEQLVFREAIFQNSLSNIFFSNFDFTFVLLIHSQQTFIGLEDVLKTSSA